MKITNFPIGVNTLKVLTAESFQWTLSDGNQGIFNAGFEY